jgi:hypothetical protein
MPPSLRRAAVPRFLTRKFLMSWFRDGAVMAAYLSSLAATFPVIGAAGMLALPASSTKANSSA